MKIKAEVDYDHQHGPIVRVHAGTTRIAVYLMDETGVVTKNDGNAHGIEVNGNWAKFKHACKLITAHIA